MPNIQSELARVFTGPQLKIDGTRPSLSVRLSDSGLNFTMYANDYGFIYYALRNMIPNSIHAVSGNFSISAYNSQTSNRAMYSVRVSASNISPVPTAHSPTVPNAETAEASNHKKLKYFVMVFIIQNWDSWNIRNAKKIEYAREIMQLHQQLKEETILPSHVVDPVTFTIVNVQTTYTTSTRPVETRQEEEVQINNNFPAVVLNTLTAAQLMENTPFNFIPLAPPRPVATNEMTD